jgi:hypothetical protein
MIKKWLEKTIIGLELCPFTRKPYLEGKILIQELQEHDFLDAFSAFQGQSKFESALLVYPDWKISFLDFYDFSEDSKDQLIDLNMEDEFQLVAFHPDFCFEGLEFGNRANLVNSSPLPLIHVLKIHDLDLLNLSMVEAEAISFGNAKKLEALELEEMKSHFPWRL